MVSYIALFEPAKEGGFVVTFPDVGHGATQGDTIEEAREMASDFLLTVLGEMMKRGESIPPARKYRGKYYRPVSLTALQSARVHLYEAFQVSGMKKSELARRLNIPRSVVDRLFDFNRGSKFDQIEDAFRALGKRVNIVVADAA